MSKASQSFKQASIDVNIKKKSSCFAANAKRPVLSQRVTVLLKIILEFYKECLHGPFTSSCEKFELN